MYYFLRGNIFMVLLRMCELKDMHSNNRTNHFSFNMCVYSWSSARSLIKHHPSHHLCSNILDHTYHHIRAAHPGIRAPLFSDGLPISGGHPSPPTSARDSSLRSATSSRCVPTQVRAVGSGSRRLSPWRKRFVS